jgi:hypothetical protein
MALGSTYEAHSEIIGAGFAAGIGSKQFLCRGKTWFGLQESWTDLYCFGKEIHLR